MTLPLSADSPDANLDAPAPAPRKWLARAAAEARRHFFLVKLAVSVLFIALLFKWIRFDDLLRAARRVHPGYFALSYAVLLATPCLTLARLKALMRPTSLWLPFWRLLRISYIAEYYSWFFPSGIGESLVRWYKVTENKKGRVQFLLVVIIEKSFPMLTGLLCVGLPLAFSTDARIQDIRRAFLPVFIALTPFVVLFYLFFLFPPLHGAAYRLLQSLRGRVRGRLSVVLDRSADLHAFCGRAGVFGFAAAMTVLVQAAIIVRQALLFRALGVSLPWLTTVWICSLAFLIQVVPISIGGVGVRESAFAYIFNVYGLGYEAGLMVGLLMLAQYMINALIGLVLALSDRGNPETGGRRIDKEASNSPH